MAKIKNKNKLKSCFNAYERGNTQRYMAKQLNITKRRFRQLYSEYKKTGEVPSVGEGVGRPKKEIDQETKEFVINFYKKYSLNSVYLERVIYAQNNLRIPHNTIHKMLINSGHAKKNPNKSKRRKPWIRYERAHSLSAVHLDWHLDSTQNKWVCVVLDDASRKILAGGEFEHANEKNSENLVQEVIDKYGSIKVLREVITDHGSPFCANKKDKNNNSNHSFEMFLKNRGIKHILCRYKHPQSNGKIEKWFDFYEVHRSKFNTFEELVNWYNNRPHGSLNLRKAETPNEAFWRKMPEEYFFEKAARFMGWLE